MKIMKPDAKLRKRKLLACAAYDHPNSYPQVMHYATLLSDRLIYALVMYN